MEIATEVPHGFLGGQTNQRTRISDASGSNTPLAPWAGELRMLLLRLLLLLLLLVGWCDKAKSHESRNMGVVSLSIVKIATHFDYFHDYFVA